ncbi:SURF1 family protein [Sphingomonas sp.]|jgi:surfeit locus 1 family protein|uniref:SURF1 family protein n=1 Tax=Sphingomonas sp. TaxID=28214 RepID=UPI002E2EB861|nr:SURF1 family protein [Sphingomonas sp.]HEX4694240.1 SURF1 family protein [Sphingomonas sp.]
MTDTRPDTAGQPAPGRGDKGPAKRFPVLATLLVALAVAAMIALGFWQLQRRTEKLALLRELSANPAKPPIAFPNPPIGEDLLFRRASAMCLEPVKFSIEGAGSAGFRVVAQCKTGAEGPGFAVQIGTTRDPAFRPQWSGGMVSGTISHAPSHVSLIAGLFGKAAPRTLLLVAATPAPGLAANAMPSVDSIPNNHLAYAVQWFLFAGVALVIYLLALRRRRRKH